MQIKIEIDVKPEELRRFLGLPDVAGLQEDLIQFLRDKVGAASDSFDPASFVRENLQSLKESSAWRKLVSAAKATANINVADEEAPLAKRAGKGTVSGERPRPARRRSKPATAASDKAPDAE